MQRHKSLPPGRAQHERHVPGKGQHPLDVGMSLIEPEIPGTSPNDPTAPAEPLMQQVQYRAQHHHVAEPAESENQGLHGPDRDRVEACRYGTRASTASAAGQLKCLILRGH